LRKRAEIFALVSFRHSTFRSLCQAGVANKIADALIWGLLPVFLWQHGLDVVAIGWVAGTYAVVWGASQLWTGLLSDRIGRKKPIVAGLWLLAAAVTSVITEQSLLPWLLSSVAMGLGMALLYPNLIAAVADISHPHWRASALGVYRYWRDTGYAIGALALGMLAQWRASAVAAFWLTAVVLFLSGLWLALGAEETHPGINPEN
jgi:MFS family permease